MDTIRSKSETFSTTGITSSGNYSVFRILNDTGNALFGCRFESESDHLFELCSVQKTFKLKQCCGCGSAWIRNFFLNQDSELPVPYCSGSVTQKIRCWIRFRNKSYRIQKNGLKIEKNLGKDLHLFLTYKVIPVFLFSV